ncbi:MAG: 4-(cytidine 5'-diphospho)-2-C-methyl-D-erythritol kinase [Pseudomonadota bacterium]
MPVVEEAPAKVNLTLQVTGQRPNGYHDLQSLVVFAQMGDQLEFWPSDELSLEVEGPFACDLGAASENLVMGAARSLQARYGLSTGALIKLSKNLPVASGIGGGSSDAAAALRGLCRLWELKPERRDLADLSLGLGADVPVCLRGEPCHMSGVGEEIIPIRLPSGLWLLLVNAMIPVSTAQVFKERQGRFSVPAALPENWRSLDSFMASLALAANDLEEAAGRISPFIGTCITALSKTQDCLLARMSGSGATCFGLFAEAAAAKKAALMVSEQYPDWWVAAAAVKGSTERLQRDPLEKLPNAMTYLPRVKTP